MKSSTVFATLLVAFLLSYEHGRSQCDSLYQLTLINERSAFVPLSMNASDTAAHIPKYYFTPGHRFSFQSDSSSVIVDVLEYRLNQRSLMLQDWCNEKTWNWSAVSNSDTNEVTDNELSQKSRTKTFPMAPGDTVSMLRWFYIKDDIADTLSYWFSDQTVDAWTIIELVDQYTGNVIEVLDSVRFSSIDNRICILSMRPSIARVVYIVPNHVSPTSAFVRVRVGNVGVNDHHWFRHDAIMDVVSWRVLPRSGVINDRYRAGNICEQQPSALPISVFALAGRTGIRINSAASSTLIVTVRGIDGFARATLSVPGGSQGIEQELPPGLYYVHISTTSGVSLGSRNHVVQ